MTRRVLLTLLALLTGLSVQQGSLHARVLPEQAAAVASAAYHRAASSTPEIARAPAPMPHSAERLDAEPAPVASQARTVLTRIDRARE